jgi:hypothetical protein
MDEIMVSELTQYQILFNPTVRTYRRFLILFSSHPRNNRTSMKNLMIGQINVVVTLEY